MANVVLKNDKGNPITYEGVSHLEVLNDSNGLQTFTDMTGLSCYYAIQSAEGENLYTVTGRWFCVTGAGYAMGSMTDAMCRQWGAVDDSGDYNLIMIFTTKSLTIGQTYHYKDLGV